MSGPWRPPAPRGGGDGGPPESEGAMRHGWGGAIRKHSIARSIHAPKGTMWWLNGRRCPVCRRHPTHREVRSTFHRKEHPPPNPLPLPPQTQMPPRAGGPAEVKAALDVALLLLAPGLISQLLKMGGWTGEYKIGIKCLIVSVPPEVSKRGRAPPPPPGGRKIHWRGGVKEA